MLTYVTLSLLCFNFISKRLNAILCLRFSCLMYTLSVTNSMKILIFRLSRDFWQARCLSIITVWYTFEHISHIFYHWNRFELAFEVALQRNSYRPPIKFKISYFGAKYICLIVTTSLSRDETIKVRAQILSMRYVF